MQLSNAEPRGAWREIREIREFDISSLYKQFLNAIA